MSGVDSLIAGNDVTITGDPVNPTVNVITGGVTSIQTLTGNITVVGNGVAISSTGTDVIFTMPVLNVVGGTNCSVFTIGLAKQISFQ